MDQVAIIEKFDLVKQDDQTTAYAQQKTSTYFDYYSEFSYWQKKYQDLCHEILNTYSDDGDDEDSEEDDFCEKQTPAISQPGPVDVNNTNSKFLRQKIFMTVHSSLDFEECAQKLELLLEPGQEKELCQMFLDCCVEMSYQSYLGSLAKRFCNINRTYAQHFEGMFKTFYSTVSSFDPNQSCSVGKFFAHLLMTDSISWKILANIKLGVSDKSSSSGVFVKTLLTELSDHMGISKEEFQSHEL